MKTRPGRRSERLFSLDDTPRYSLFHTRFGVNLKTLKHHDPGGKPSCCTALVFRFRDAKEKTVLAVETLFSRSR